LAPTPEASTPAATVRVLIVDDHEGFREILRWIISAIPDFAVVAEADDGTTALEAARASSPDLVLMDIEMPEMDGLTATRAMTGEDAAVVVILISATEIEPRLARAYGASAFLSKYQLSPGELRHLWAEHGNRPCVRAALDAEA
jgi:DNA-binding NarL/FixJ family response regulator